VHRLAHSFTQARWLRLNHFAVVWLVLCWLVGFVLVFLILCLFGWFCTGATVVTSFYSSVNFVIERLPSADHCYIAMVVLFDHYASVHAHCVGIAHMPTSCTL
jgi:4-hydroxybenzoate polyprenyltransferase